AASVAPVDALRARWTGCAPLDGLRDRWTGCDTTGSMRSAVSPLRIVVLAGAVAGAVAGVCGCAAGTPGAHSALTRGALSSGVPAAHSAAVPAARTRAAHSAGMRSALSAGASSPAPPAAAAVLRDWPEFGLDPQRSDTSGLATGITAANVAGLLRRTVALPGTVDSSPIYLHGVRVGGAMRDVIVVTTTYGRTLAIDARSGRIVWTFTPPGYGRWAGSAQITTATPLADPDRRFIYAASPNGLIEKLSLADGAAVRSGGWPAHVTRDATHEKLAAALNIDGPYLVVATGGYLGDIPPYQGHVLTIDRASGRVHAVFNTLCANRRGVIVPSSCAGSDSAIWSRAGAVMEPGGGRVLVTTGNGPWNGATDFGDSALELSFPGLRRRQAFTPSNQQALNENDTDLGSGGPALLSAREVLIGGKDGVLRVLDLAQMDGHPPAAHEVLGGEVQRLALPGGGQLLTEPAVWRRGGRATVFVAGQNGTAAYALRDQRLHLVWQNGSAGTSPVLAGGLLYVYDPTGGGIEVYSPSSPRPLARLPGAPGHWNSPIVVDGHVIEPEGDANEHRSSGTLEIFSTPLAQARGGLGSR
ncbi:MAG: PQQ-binding-like beta-propeller repeat protein, partial [Solirubrobacterales bacterium]|nr:PQQ-binding-like beta-propeller repeat protein [Solirubrobacterales bacterium]